MKRFLILLLFIITSCKTAHRISSPVDRINLITLDPGHFHAALVQKSMYSNVDSVVYVYAPQGSDLELHLQRIESYNKRSDNPTRWKQQLYTCADFLDRMLQERKGNVVVMAGNNKQKTEYISKAVEAGYHVLADKPMAINSDQFQLLKKTFETAAKKNVLLYDIMTERYEITTILQREFSLLPEIFGELEKGSPENPAVTKESVHHFYKYVSGSVLTRPAWFMDVKQQGEGVVDVTTHLVDLIQWECFPEQIINYENDVRITSARRWPTSMSLPQFSAITKLNTFPDYLKSSVEKDTILEVYSNGEINYTLRDVHAKVSVIWAYQAPEGTGDTHYSIMRGTKANLVIRQGADENYKPALYIEPASKASALYENALREQLKSIQKNFPGIDLKKSANGWEVVIPDRYKEGHEAHFARVTEKFLEYLQKGKLPQWEVPNMLAKYYTTTQALEVAIKTK